MSDENGICIIDEAVNDRLVIEILCKWPFSAAKPWNIANNSLIQSFKWYHYQSIDSEKTTICFGRKILIPYQMK